MICDWNTDKVYLAEGIKGYEKLAESLLMKLYNEGVDTEYLPRTKSKKHVWARDYMPIQCGDGRFVQYVYDPDYLKRDRDYIPRYDLIFRELGLDCKKTRLIVDGGNVVRGERGVIMTDKVLKENSLFQEHYVLGQLEKLFDGSVCLIPRDGYDMFGHADGMVRFINRDTVLLNNYIDFDKELRRRLTERLRWHGFSIEELHYDRPRCTKYTWAYLNYLQVDGRIFVPGIGADEDYLALEQIGGFFPESKVILVPGCLELLRDGGALNCISWNIRSDVKPGEREMVSGSSELPE